MQILRESGHPVWLPILICLLVCLRPVALASSVKGKASVRVAAQWAAMTRRLDGPS